MVCGEYHLPKAKTFLDCFSHFVIFTYSNPLKSNLALPMNRDTSKLEK